MRPKPKVVVIDADAIVAQANTEDANHLKAGRVVERLDLLKVRVLYPATAIAEAVTVIQTKMNSLATALGTAVVFSNPGYDVVEVDQEIYKYAVDKYFAKVTNKKDTMFDCIVCSIAKKYRAEAIFSFDKFYKKCGFKLASEL